MAEASGGADEEGSSDTAARSEPNGANLGRHIPRDDGVKDELKTLEEAKEMRVFLARYGGERLRSVFWEMTKVSPRLQVTGGAVDVRCSRAGGALRATGVSERTGIRTRRIRPCAS
jgi:hypothetical protein